MASASRRYLVNLPTIHRPLTPPPPSSCTLSLATTGLSAYLLCLGSDPGNSLNRWNYDGGSCRDGVAVIQRRDLH